jgi:thymidylate synthase (FAD)
MKIIEPSFEFLNVTDGNSILKSIEKAGRVCYKSEDKITSGSSKEFIQKILQSGHESIIEHEKITVKIVCDRGVSHEIVRHRIASYSQESTRYCNYSKDKFGNQLTLIRPFFWRDDPEKYTIWEKTMQTIENNYNKLISIGARPEEARSILPNSLKTEIVVTMNLREWRHFFKLRTAKEAHPQMREITLPMLRQFKEKIPIIFDDIELT